MLAPALKQVAYDPARYIDIETVDEAVNIIVTPIHDPDGNSCLTAKERWDKETPALMQIIERHIKRKSLVLDYGCGIGRLAKPLIAKLDCKVIGLDISPNMRALATSLVDNSMFCAMDPSLFDLWQPAVSGGFDAAIAVWTLQHCIDLERALDRVWATMKPAGKLFVVNNKTRCLPVENGEWADDGLNVHEMIMDAAFTNIDGGVLDASIAPGWMQQETFWAVYQRN